MVTLDSIGLGRAVLDSAGKGIVEFTLDAPVFVGVNAGKFAAGLLVFPGDELTIVPSKPGSKHAFSFEGDGAAAQEFINEAGQFRQGLEKWNGTYSFRLDQDTFLLAKDSLQKGYDQLLAKIKSNPGVSQERMDLLQRNIKMSVLAYQFNFANGTDSVDIPPSVRKVIRELPADSIALKTAMFDFALIATFYQHKMNEAIYEENEKMNSDSLAAIFPLLVDEKIKSKKYPKLVEELLRVKSVDYQIGSSGLSPSILKLAGKLESEIASNDFKKVIREDIARWEKIGPGKPAPVFSGLTPDGKKLSLSDFRGKVVYVDIWATWCGPCVEEFPDSKKLLANFKGNDKVAFLYVSVDRDTLAWKKMVAGDKVPKGIHIIDDGDSPQSIWNQYYVWGIPRYLLIDTQGRMVAAHAKRPSSGKVADELKRLLIANELAQN
ncbi:TlpA disulfide reductase family protein [Dyadobacter sp. SG02]|uniref:TlpA family protein disulfide reductase n=1 Tax=Dyadobacter sp. SG02 TaxID=1855291 RepID=UPI001E438741|nr:TlpA disulfide reductase family protein [Dyadobacter sp. SG02]